MKQLVNHAESFMRFEGLRTRGRILVLLAAAAAALGTMFAMGGRWWWVLELFTHFRCHYLAALLLGTGFCLATKRWWLAATFGCCAAFNLALIVPLYLPERADAVGGQSVRLILANVHLRNPDHDRFMNLVRDESPDIIVVLEVTHEWQKALDTIADKYPYHVIRPRGDSFGIAFLSRLPAANVEVREIGPAEVPSVVARIDCGENAVLELIGTHPLPPIGAEYAALRNEQLHDVGEFVRHLSRPTVLVGDLNSTSWSPFFRDLLLTSGLRDSRTGFGVQPTWPGRLALIGIPIDHVLVSPGVSVVRRTVGPNIGSDHRPVLIDLLVLPSAESGELSENK